MTSKFWLRRTQKNDQKTADNSGADNADKAPKTEKTIGNQIAESSYPNAEVSDIFFRTMVTRISSCSLLFFNLRNRRHQ